MKIEFEYCKEPLDMNEDTVRFLAKKGSHHYVLLQKSDRRYNDKTFKTETVTKEVIETIEIHPNVTVLGHDFFFCTRREGMKLLGFCPVEFPEGIEVHF